LGQPSETKPTLGALDLAGSMGQEYKNRLATNDTNVHKYKRIKAIYG